MAQSVLVTGATGYIGGRLVPRLLELGHRVRCLARHPENLAGRRWPGVEIARGDVLEPATLDAALAGIDVAYYLIHSMGSGEAAFEANDRQAAENFAAAAERAGIKRIIYLGGLGASQDLSAHLQSRQEVGAILGSHGVPVTEFRAAIIVGSGSLSFEMIRYLTERLPVMICPRWLKSRCQPIAIRDVLSYLLAALEEPRSIGKIFEIGGADVLSYREMMLQYAEARGLKRWLLQVPVLTPRLSSYWVDLVTPIPAAMARPLIEGLRNDVVCQNQDALEVFPVRPITYRRAVDLALHRIQLADVETIWSGSHAYLKPGEVSTTRYEKKEGMIVEIRQSRIAASAEQVYRIFSGIGGGRRWYYANWAWRMRGWIDRLFGGVGMRRGRRHPDQLVPGDVLDFWRVEEVQEGKLLRLRAEMKVPGKAWLQFEVEPSSDPGESVYTQTAFFEPHGLGGLLYWYVLYPIHQIIFSGLDREIERRALA